MSASSAASGSSAKTTPFVPDSFDPPAKTHHGSSLSLASDEEIKDVEKRLTIPEEEEEEDCEDAKAAK
jgi:hypothetical protein